VTTIQVADPTSGAGQALNIHYHVQGEGRDVVLVHGWASSWRLWQGTMRVLAEMGCRVCALDLPGFGASDKPDDGWYSVENFAATVAAFCRALGLERARVVGHSMGGTIALALGLAQPALVERLVAVSPVVSGRIGLPVRVFAAGRVGRWLYDQSVAFWPLAAAGAQTLYSRSWSLKPRAYHRRNWEDLAQASPHAALGCLRALADFDLRSQLGAITAPTLLMTGAGDLNVPPSHARIAAARIPGSRLVVLRGARHLPMDERPEAFHRELTGFLTA
jgi:pimeloyl-ACP methyl ester carboxylesterase